MMINATDRDKMTTRYLRAADIGSIALLVLVGLFLVGFEPAPGTRLRSASMSFLIAGVALIALIYSLLMLFRRRLRDEYLESLWSAGTSVAFVVAVLWSTGLALLTGTIRGFNDSSDTAVTLWLREVGDEVSLVTMMGFFIAFQIKRWRTR